MTQKDQYEVNFFKPLTEHARANKRLILVLAILWLVGVFGFQILLMVFNKPTPEDNYTKFEAVWPAVVADASASNAVKQDFARVVLAVLGKNIAVKDTDKVYLKEALSWTLYSMQNDSVKKVFQQQPDSETFKVAVSSIGLASQGFDKLMSDLLPSSLIKVEAERISAECQAAIPRIMELYLVHNQSGLTKLSFLGFPFHYWYTAQFLLIMFVLLCLVYARVIDKMNVKYDFIEET
jgi:putative solute:sodium symporter small subunit